MLRVEEVMWNWGGMGRDIGVAEQVPKILTNHRAGEGVLSGVLSALLSCVLSGVL